MAAFTGIPLLVIAVFQLSRNLRLQRADFVKEYIGKFFIDKELNESFHYLINSYSNSDFQKIDKISNLKNLAAKNLPLPIFDPFKEMNESKAEGFRLYHPEYFQWSEEERRLDGLLGYFDVIGYYYHRGFLKMDDIVGSLGWILTVLRAKEVVQRYLRFTDERFQKLREENTIDLSHALPPFIYLKRLLDDFERYNQKTGEQRLQVLSEAVPTVGFFS